VFGANKNLRRSLWWRAAPGPPAQPVLEEEEEEATSKAWGVSSSQLFALHSSH